MTDPIAICNCIQCPILTQYQTTQMISLDYASTFELGPFSANTKAKQYQECETLITRIEVRIMRLRREKGERKRGALQATQDPDVPNNNTGIILSIIPVLILVIIYYSSSIENTASIIYYCTFTILML